MSLPVAGVPEMTTAGGLLLVLMLVLPLLGVLAALASGGRNARRVVLVALSLGFALAIALGIELVQSGQTLVYVLGGWAPPLGIALRADGLCSHDVHHGTDRAGGCGLWTSRFPDAGGG